MPNKNWHQTRTKCASSKARLFSYGRVLIPSVGDDHVALETNSCKTQQWTYDHPPLKLVLGQPGCCAIFPKTQQWIYVHPPLSGQLSKVP